MLLLLVHHHRRRAHEDRRKALRRDARLDRHVGDTHVDRDQCIDPHRRNCDGEVVGGAPIDAGAAANDSRGKESGKGTRRIHRVPDPHVSQPWAPEYNRRRAFDIDGRDQQWHRQVVEGTLAHERVAQVPERRFEVDRPGEHALHQHAKVVDAEEISPTESECALRQFVGGNSACRRCGDHRADARTSIQTWCDPRFCKRP